MTKSILGTSRLSRRSFVVGTAASLAATVCTGSEPGKRPNILWLIAEDQCIEQSCYGNPDVHTPNIDRLAAEGARYTRAYSTAPVCAASRSALATGMYQTSIGAHNHRSHRHDDFRLPEGVHVFTHYLRQAGYHTSNLTNAGPGVHVTTKTDYNFATSYRIEDYPAPPQDHGNSQRGVFDGTDWNQREIGQPFFAQITFFETHRYFRRFPSNPTDPAKVHLPPFYPDHPAVREDWAMYLDTMQHLDVAVGKVVDRLKQENLLDETIIFYFADHGKGLERCKEYLYEGGIHIPLIVRVPEQFKIPAITPGTVSDDLISAIDITAATLKLAGAPVPKHFAGIDFLDPSVAKREYVFAARDRIDDTVDHVRSVDSKRFKYLRNFYPDRPYAQPNAECDTYPILRVMRDLHKEGKLTPEQALFLAETRPPEELYDLETDPYEVRNLAGLPEYRETLVHLRGVLDRWIKETGDQGGIPEDPRVMEMPEELEYRKQVDGWSTGNYTNCRLAKAGGKLRVTCSGPYNTMKRAVVTEGGELTLCFKARSTQAAPTTFLWDSVTDFANPLNRVPINFTPDGEAHECAVQFKAEGHLAVLRIDFGKAEGDVEFDWIRLYRKQPGEPVLITEFDFSS